MLRAVLPPTARQFARAIVMPNLVPPIVTVADALGYRGRILAALPPDARFEPLMTLYLTDTIAADEVERGRVEGVITAAKLYPAHATTNAALGVTSIERIRGVLARMERIGLPLLVHGEVTDPRIDVFDREAVFIERVLAPLLADHPGLRIVFEHATTEEAVAFVAANAPRVAATITPHHLMINRNAMFAGGIRPHMYCLPVAKRERHRQALRRAATSGAGCFFLGTDSAPHPVSAKEAECGCAGIFNAPVALACYAEVFAEMGALANLEAFASVNGARYYGLPVNEERITLIRDPVSAPAHVTVTGGERVRSFRAGESLAWRVAEPVQHLGARS